MAKIYLTKGRIIEVPQSEAVRIGSQWEGKTPHIAITDSLTVKCRDITGVDKGSTTKVEYDIDSHNDRAVVHDFERMLAQEEVKQPPHPIDWYGEPHELFVERHPEHKVRPGWVFNPLLGLVHWSVAEYGIQQGFWLRAEDGHWAHVLYGENRSPAVSTGLLEFEAKWKALKALRARRTFARGREEESKNKLIGNETAEFAAATRMDEELLDQETDADGLPVPF